MEFKVNILQICLRLVLAVIFSGLIGFDREFKNRPAGMRTHMLVCVGAVVVAIIQREIMTEALRIAIESPELAGVIRSDPARLICQVISGIGFLGAGTIIVTKRAVVGLTTAASLWAVAGLGLALGMGYYMVSIISFFFIFLVLSLLQRFIHIPSQKRIEIRFKNPVIAKEKILEFFNSNSIVVRDADYDIDFASGERIYTNVFTVEVPKKLNYSTVIEELALQEDIVRIRAVNL